MLRLRAKLLKKDGRIETALFGAASSAASAMDYVHRAPGNALASIADAMNELRYARRRLKKSVGSVGKR